MLIVNSRIQRCLKKTYSKTIADSSSRQDSNKNARILLVDDQELNRDVLAHRLKKSGYTITCVKSGSEALETLKTEIFDLMLLDIMMPDMSGVDVLKNVRSSEKQKVMPVIMVTAMDDMETINECMLAGANDYILKPLNIQLFKIRMSTCLGNHQE
jgi:DNA-binding response OmpR family regulator